MKICVIDDDPIYIFTIGHLLKHISFEGEIEVYKDGKEAFEGLKESQMRGDRQPELILLDLNMPVWDGWDFLREYEKLQGAADAAVYIASSSDHPDDVSRAEQHSLVKGVLLKPLTADILKDLIAALRPREKL